MRRTFVIGFLLTAAVLAQSFDVATVKPHPPSGDMRIRVMMNGGPGSQDPGRLNYENVTLKQVLAEAFNVKQYQISVPAWAESERYDMTAKVPQGATKEQFRVMLQNLLAERFKMTYRRETKEMGAYALVVAKGGPKLKASEEQPGKKDDALPPPPPGGGTAGVQRMQMGKDGFPVIPHGGRAMMMMPGKAKLSASAMTIADLLDMLSTQLDRPAVDETGLKGKYDFTLEFAPEMGKMPMGMGPMPPGMGGPGGPPPPPAEGDAAPALFTALQEQLGLKLEAKKAPVEIVTVDHIEKTPTEN